MFSRSTRRNDPASDRMVTAVFLAALVHGLVILGVRFSTHTDSNTPLPTLEVLLVPPGPDNPEANLDAAYIAERTQQGSGTSAEARRSSLPEDVQRESADDTPIPEAEAPVEEAAPGSVSVLARRAVAAERLPVGDERSTVAPVFQALPTPSLPPIGLNAAVADEELHLRGQRAADGSLLADTRESAIAGYLEGWKRRIERVGTINFPNEARRRSMSGNPVVEVAIRANGSLEGVVIRRSSGHAELDNAAVGIVRLAAPFDPFPAALRERYPVLRFAYEWQFLNGRLGGDGTVFTTNP